VIPARSRATFYIKVPNLDITVGYVPRLSVGKDIYLGEAVVENRNGKAYLHAINSGDTDRELIVPTVELREIETTLSDLSTESEAKQIATGQALAISTESIPDNAYKPSETHSD